PNHLNQRLRYLVAEGNLFKDSIDIDHGTEHSMLRNNVLRIDNEYGIKIDAYSSTYQRGVVDLNIVNNTEYTLGNTNDFIKTTGTASGISVINNLWIAPKVWTGAYNAAGLYVAESS